MCCQTPGEIIYQGTIVCKNCSSELDKVVFEEYLTKNVDKSHRLRKFTDLIISKNLPWYATETLFDLFPKIENYFLNSDRINFINLNQLTRELLIMIGHEELCYLFPALKTKSRAKQVKQFVYKALPYNPYCGELKKLEDLEFIKIKSSSVDLTENDQYSHIYNDRRSY